MKAHDVARVLRAKGIRLLEVVEGTHDEDGAVYVTPTVHVQVPTYGTEVGVVEELPDGSFLFHPVTRSIDRVIAKIRELDARQCVVSDVVAVKIATLCR